MAARDGCSAPSLTWERRHPAGNLERSAGKAGISRTYAARASRSGSTKMTLASSSLIASRELQTWQMTLRVAERSLIVCSWHKPISRSRFVSSAESGSCLIRTDVPARTRLNGQSGPPAQLAGCGTPMLSSALIELESNRVVSQAHTSIAEGWTFFALITLTDGKSRGVARPSSAARSLGVPPSFVSPTFNHP
jgi:hypothetical protein